MKNKSKILIAAIAATLSFGMYSCGNLITDKKFEFAVGEVVAPVTVTIQDAKTGAMPAGLSFTVTGKDAAAVIHANNMDGGLVARNRILEIGLRKGMMPTVAKPYTFNLIAKAEGYLNGIASVTLTADKKTQVILNMNKISNLPVSVRSAQGTGLATAAGPRQDIRTNTSPGPNNVPTSNVVVERETAFLGEGGKILSGDVNVLVVQEFETGLITTDTEPIAPISGLVTVEMTVGGVQVHGFANKKTKIAMEISSTDINMNTGDPYKAGDIVQAISRNDATGKWTKEGDVTVTKDGEGKLWGTIETTHLSAFALYSNQSVVVSVTMSINKGNVPNGKYWMELKAKGATSQIDFSRRFGGSGYVDISIDSFVFDNKIVPSAYLRYTANLYYRKPLSDTDRTALLMGSCSFSGIATGASVNLSRPAGFTAPNNNVTFDVYTYCLGKQDEKIRPDATITFKEKGALYDFSYLGDMDEGKFSTDMLKVGVEYIFNTTYTGNFVYTVKQTNSHHRPLASGEGGASNPCGK